MRIGLLLSPRLLCERLADLSSERRRLKRLKGTVAASLKVGHIDSLELLELLRDRPPQVIYDIGANVGTWTLLAKAVFPKAEVHAFEPLAGLKARFLKNTQGIGGVYLHQVALGAESTKMSMKVADFVDASSLLEMTEAQTIHFHSRTSAEETVAVCRLDDYVKNVTLPKPDLLKLDIQGYELEALRGAEETLKSVAAVLSEVSFVEFYRGQCTFDGLIAFLASHNLHAQSFHVRTPLGTRLLQSDMLFERSRRSIVCMD